MEAFNFQIWHASCPDDLGQWLDSWKSWPEREVFAHPAYVSLFAGPEDRVACAAYSDGQTEVLYPFICRDLRALPWYEPTGDAAADLTTPYGYGGPFVRGISPTDGFTTAFWSAFDDWARGQSIVTEFVRFSLFSDALLPYPGATVVRAANVVRDLEMDEDALWMDFKHKVRKNIKKARRSNIRIERDDHGQYLDDFLRIYRDTMDRRDSSEGYYFPPEFFRSIHDRLAGQFMYFHALREDRIISTELVLVSTENVYSFLGGTDSATFELRPNDLLKYEVMRWARQEGKKRFVLGGGYEPEDGIFKYKLSFAPNGAVPFRTGQRILNETLCQRLVQQKARFEQSRKTDWSPQSSFFPLYRA